MRDANQINPTTVAKPIVSERMICQAGGVSVVILTIIVIGARNGNIDAQNASEEFGLRIIGMIKKNPATNIKTTGIANCPPSCVVVTIDPIRA